MFPFPIEDTFLDSCVQLIIHVCIIDYTRVYNSLFYKR